MFHEFLLSVRPGTESQFLMYPMAKDRPNLKPSPATSGQARKRIPCSFPFPIKNRATRIFLWNRIIDFCFPLDLGERVKSSCTQWQRTDQIWSQALRQGVRHRKRHHVLQATHIWNVLRFDHSKTNISWKIMKGWKMSIIDRELKIYPYIAIIPEIEN